jgi:hypothetical protein
MRRQASGVWGTGYEVRGAGTIDSHSVVNQLSFSCHSVVLAKPNDRMTARPQDRKTA